LGVLSKHFNLPALYEQLAAEQLEQGGLARPVLSQQSVNISPVNLQIQTGEQRFALV
jgi:hypothetical protein